MQSILVLLVVTNITHWQSLTKPLIQTGLHVMVGIHRFRVKHLVAVTLNLGILTTAGKEGPSTSDRGLFSWLPENNHGRSNILPSPKCMVHMWVCMGVAPCRISRNLCSLDRIGFERHIRFARTHPPNKLEDQYPRALQK